MINRINRGAFMASMKTTKNSKPSNEAKTQHDIPVNDETDDLIDTIAYRRLTPEDMTPEGKIPIIITGNSSDELKKAKAGIAKGFSIEDAKFRDELPIVDGLKVDVDPAQFRKLMKSLPEGTNVVLDTKIKFSKPQSFKLEAKSEEKIERPSLDIANSTLGVNRLWEQGFTGKGVGICVIDSGIYPHKDFGDRIKGFVDMNDGQLKPYDPYGHGTHVAGIAAGSGVESNGKFKGVAPDADIIGVRITSVAEAIKGIQWAIENKDTYNIKVVNMSLGDFPIKSYKTDPWAQAAEKAWDSGIMVVVAAGNEGPGEGTVSTPGIDPKVLTVGAIDDKNTPEREDDSISLFTSRGPTTPDGLVKPDVVAPGVEIFGPLSPGSTLDSDDLPHVDNKYIAMSGSSMATPIVSGLAALLIQANPDLTNNDIKKIMMETAENYIPGLKPTDQGAGLVDPLESLQVALNRKKGGSVDVPSIVKPADDAPILLSDNVARKNQNA